MPKAHSSEQPSTSSLPIFRGQLTLLGDVVVHELREIDVRGDRG